MIEIKRQKYVDQSMHLSENANHKAYPLKFKSVDHMLSQQYEPEQILCREQEIKKIKSFIAQFMACGESKQSLYISGHPGIGKTLSVNRAIQSFKNRQDSKKNTLKFVKLNSMNLKTASDVYKNIYYELIQKVDTKIKKPRLDPQAALLKLDAIFKRSQDVEQQFVSIMNMKKVIFIDEIDYLKTQDQQILYNLFDWTQYQQSRLAIICISNTIDFPQKLQPKILSRIGNKRIVFRPYNSNQLQKILFQRVIVEGQAFEKQAVQFISKRIAKSTGDIHAIFWHIRQTSKSELPNSKVSISRLNKSYQNVYIDHYTQMYTRLPKIYRQILFIMAQHFRRYDRMLTLQHICQTAKNKFDIAPNQIKSVLMNLCDLSLVQGKILMNPNTHFKWLKKWNYKLNIQPSKILFCVGKYDEDIANS